MTERVDQTHASSEHGLSHARERGAKALEERMGKRAAAQATSQASNPALPASTLPNDLEAGIVSMPAASVSIDAAS